MDPENFSDWLEKLAQRFAECDFSFFCEDIKQEVARWDTGVDENGSL